jgi:N-acetyl-S-(2-succino)cysteine monooxygenase
LAPPLVAGRCGPQRRASPALARTAGAGFNPLFLANGVSIRDDDLDVLSRTAIRYIGQFEPPALLS